MLLFVALLVKHWLGICSLFEPPSTIEILSMSPLQPLENLFQQNTSSIGQSKQTIAPYLHNLEYFSE